MTAFISQQSSGKGLRGMLEFKLSGNPALHEMGYLNVQSLAGGFDAWVAAGKPQPPSFE